MSRLSEQGLHQAARRAGFITAKALPCLGKRQDFARTSPNSNFLPSPIPAQSLRLPWGRGQRSRPPQSAHGRLPPRPGASRIDFPSSHIPSGRPNPQASRRSWQGSEAWQRHSASDCHQLRSLGLVPLADAQLCNATDTTSLRAKRLGAGRAKNWTSCPNHVGIVTHHMATAQSCRELRYEVFGLPVEVVRGELPTPRSNSRHCRGASSHGLTKSPFTNWQRSSGHMKRR